MPKATHYRPARPVKREFEAVMLESSLMGADGNMEWQCIVFGMSPYELTMYHLTEEYMYSKKQALKLLKGQDPKSREVYTEDTHAFIITL